MADVIYKRCYFDWGGRCAYCDVGLSRMKTGGKVKASFVASDRTYGARRVWRDLLADGADCGLHRIARLMRLQGLRARPRRRRLPKDDGDRQLETVPANLLDRQFAAERPSTPASSSSA